MSQTNQQDTKPYYLVVSNMRSGSSAVARVMHENMGIRMFIKPPEPDEFNPQGYYEDVDVTNLNEFCLRKQFTLQKHIELISKYAIKIILEYGYPWGLKDGRIALLGPSYKRMLPDARIIRLYRREEDIVKSMIKKYAHLGYTEKTSKNRIFQTNLFIDAVWGDNIWASLDMTEKRSDEEIENAIRERTREI